MILDGLRVLLFGMLGVFIIMGIIVLVTYIMNFLGKKRKKDEPDRQS